MVHLSGEDHVTGSADRSDGYCACPVDGINDYICLGAYAIVIVKKPTGRQRESYTDVYKIT